MLDLLIVRGRKRWTLRIIIWEILHPSYVFQAIDLFCFTACATTVRGTQNVFRNLLQD